MEDAISDDPLRCKRTDGRDWRCKRHVTLGQSFCPSHLHRRPKPTPLRIRVRVKPEPTQPTPAPVPDHLRCHRNDGRTWRCKKQVLQGQTLCEVHFNKAKAQNQRKRKKVGPGSGSTPELGVVVEGLRCGNKRGTSRWCKKVVVEGESLCEMHLRKLSNSNVFKLRNCDKTGNVGSESLPPDNVRCKKNDGRDWRCKRRVFEGHTLCEAHFKRVKIRDLSGGDGEGKKRGKITKKRKNIENVSNAGGAVSGGGEVVIKVENEEGSDDVMEGPAVTLAVTEERVVRSEKGKRKPVVTVAVAVLHYNSLEFLHR